MLCIQAGIGVVSESGLFGSIYFENTISSVTLPANMTATDTSQQDQVSISSFNSVVDSLTWGWLKNFFMPTYNLDSGVKALVDSIVWFLRGITGLVLGAAIIEFFRNRIQVL